MNQKIPNKLYYEGKLVDCMSKEELVQAVYALAKINDQLRENARKYNELYISNVRLK